MEIALEENKNLIAELKRKPEKSKRKSANKIHVNQYINEGEHENEYIGELSNKRRRIFGVTDVGDEEEASLVDNSDSSSLLPYFEEDYTTVNKGKQRNDWFVIKSALLRYKDFYGDLNVPKTFEIPSNSPNWPDDNWMLKLGEICKDIRSGKRYRKRRDELLEIGFPFSGGSSGGDRIIIEFEVSRLALKTYFNIYGDLEVPCAFCIPIHDHLWPENTWGLKLGNIAERIRHNGFYKEHRDVLIKMGFPFSISKALPWPRLQAALLKYKEVFGDLRIPFTYVVPSKSEWPKNTWGVNLGHRVDAIRRGRNKEYMQHLPELLEMGFIFRIRAKRRDSREMQEHESESTMV